MEDTYPSMVVDEQAHTVRYCKACAWHHDDVEFYTDRKGNRVFKCLLTKKVIIVSHTPETIYELVTKMLKERSGKVGR